MADAHTSSRRNDCDRVPELRSMSPDLAELEAALAAQISYYPLEKANDCSGWLL